MRPILLAVGVFVAGVVFSGRMALAQYSQQWSRPLAGSGSQSDRGVAIAVDGGPPGLQTGYSFVAGQFFTSGTKSVYRTRCYNPDGSDRWSVGAGNYGPAAGLHVPHHIAVESLGPGDAADYVYVTGESPGINGSIEIATIKLNAVTGAQVWAARYANSDYAAGNDVGRFVAVGAGAGTVGTAARGMSRIHR